MRGAPLDAPVLSFLSSGPATIDQIAASVECSRPGVAVALRRLMLHRLVSVRGYAERKLPQGGGPRARIYGVGQKLKEAA